MRQVVRKKKKKKKKKKKNLRRINLSLRFAAP